MDIIYRSRRPRRHQLSSRRTDWKRASPGTPIEHLMDNYSCGRLPGIPHGRTHHQRGHRCPHRYHIRHGDHSVRAGVESYWNDFNGYQQNMDTSALQDMFRNAERDRLGAYGEWQQDWNSDWRSLAGLRYDRVESDADDVIQFLPASAALAAMFNAASTTSSTTTGNGWCRPASPPRQRRRTSCRWRARCVRRACSSATCGTVQCQRRPGRRPHLYR